MNFVRLVYSDESTNAPAISVRKKRNCDDAVAVVVDGGVDVVDIHAGMFDCVWDDTLRLRYDNSVYGTASGACFDRSTLALYRQNVYG